MFVVGGWCWFCLVEYLVEFGMVVEDVEIGYVGVVV